MSVRYPRRVKDLPTLELDSEDEFNNTPLKETAPVATKFELNNQANKENEAINVPRNTIGSNTTGNNAFNNLRMYPKRSSELPALESDSEEDDNINNDNLNCAILNDSFIISPGRSEPDESFASLRNECELSDVKVKQDVTEQSFILRFDKMALESANKAVTEATNQASTILLASTENDKIAALPQICIATTSAHLPKEHKINANGSGTAATSVQRYNSDPQERRKDVDTPFKTTQTDAATLSAAQNTTEAHFVTPQIRSFSVHRRPRDLCSSQTQKTRSAIVNEFRSQKVLFQTPMPLSRAPIACMSNDSITLSLCDTINEVGGTPSTAEKSPPAKHEEQGIVGKSKKSLEDAFIAAENRKSTEVMGVIPKSTVVPDVSSCASTENSSSVSSAPAGKQTVLHINNTAYTIVKKLGCGGSSQVYLARLKDNGRECALKVVDLQGDPAVVEGYMNETKLLAKLQGNICVVALYDYQLLQNESKLYMIMEKGDSDLNKILQTYTTNLPLYVLMNILYQMLQAVNYIHRNGVIHSDLKPANFLMVNGRLKLIDFGIASNIAIDSTSIIKFSQAGTFNYISPEALTDTSTGSSPMRNNQPKIKISTKSDVWSLGCILYLLLYKKTPFSHLKNIYAKISAISSPTYNIEYPAVPPYYPVMLVHMVKNCLQHNPKKRPSCAELLQYPFHMVISIQNLAVPSK